MSTLLAKAGTVVSRHYKALLNVVMGIYALKRTWDVAEGVGYHLQMNKGFGVWSSAEFLINYQGGFVRRGLMGELLYRFSLLTGIAPCVPIAVFCLLCLFAVAIFFVWQFRRNQIVWWILPLSFFLSSTVVRKDYFFVVVVILIALCFRRGMDRRLKLTLVNLLTVFSILSHEAFFFVCTPLVCWLIVRDRTYAKSLPVRILWCTPMLLAMASACLFHGDESHVLAIVHSWEPFFQNRTDCLVTNPENSEIEGFYSGCIGSLSWTTAFAVWFHLSTNFTGFSMGLPKWLAAVCMLLYTFYFVLNYVSSFCGNRQLKVVWLTRLLIFQFVSLLPLFTVLSNDTCRIYFYWITSFFSFWLLLPAQVQERLFPRWFSGFTDCLNGLVTHRLKAPKWLVVCMMMFIAAPGIWNNLYWAIQDTVVCEYYRIFLVLFGLLT